MFETRYEAEALKGHQNEEFEKLKEKEVKIVVDATGELLINTLKYQPFLIKPNNHELVEIFNVEVKSIEDIEYYVRRENDHIQDWQHNGSHSWKCEPEESGRSNGKIFESCKKEAKR